MSTTDTNVNKLIVNKLTASQYEAIETPSNTELYFVEDPEDTLYAKDAQVVHNVGTEQVRGVKTFVDGVILNAGTAITVADTDNSNNIATTAYVQNVIESLVQRIEQLEQQVAALTGE